MNNTKVTLAPLEADDREQFTAGLFCFCSLSAAGCISDSGTYLPFTKGMSVTSALIGSQYLAEVQLMGIVRGVALCFYLRGKLL